MRVSTLICAIYLFVLATCTQVKAEKSHLGVDSDIKNDSKEIADFHKHSKLKSNNISVILENLSADISAFGNSTTLLYELHEIEPFIDRIKNLTDILLQSDEKVLQPLIMMLEQLTNILRTSFIPKYEKGTTFRDNIAFLIASDPILGLRVHNTSGEGFMNSSFEYLYQIPSAESDYYSINNSDAVVLIQSSVQGFIVLRQDYNITNSTIENGLINSIILFVFRDIIYTSVQSTTHNCLNLEMAQSARESGWRWDGRCSSSKMSTSGRWLCNCINLIYPYECKLHDTGTTTTQRYATTLSPADIINEITDDIKNIFQNPPIYITKVDKTFDKINMLLSIDEDVVFPGELLQLIQKLGMTIDLMGSQSDRIVKEKIALLIADAGDLYPVRGLRVASSDVNISVHEAFEILLMDVDSTHLTVKETDAMVHLPQSVINIPRRISFTVFNNKRVFDNEGESIVNSRVVSVNVENYTHFESGEVVTLHFKPIKEPERDQRRSCAYWHYLENGTGYWSQEGCTFISSNNPDILDSCQCDHLIHFAEILIPRPVFSEGNENALEILSVIGCSLSIFGIFLVLLTAAVFETWRSKFRNQIWLQLCIALLILSICFLIILHVKYLYFSASCMFVGIVLHYSVLASFCWMFVAAAIAYKDTIPFGKHITHTVMKTSAFSWGAPIVIIGILLISAPRSYVGRFEDMTPTGSFCYPSGQGLWLSVFMPICLTLLINVIAFFYMIRVVYKSEQNTKLGKQKASYREVALKCTSTAFVLMFLFGLPWIFGLFAFNIVAAYLFTITVTIQGFVLFLFIVCGYDDTRKAWINKLQSIFNTTSRNVSKFVSSSTHLN